MLNQYNPIDIERILRSESPPPPFPPASDRSAWEDAKLAIGQERYDEIITLAEADSQRDIPVLTATHYLRFKRTGERRSYESLYFQRRQMLSHMAIAECLEYKGRFLDPLLNIAWAICEESSWAVPAHQTDLADLTHPVIDLFGSITALELAELDLLLGDALDPALGQRIRGEANWRLFDPFLNRHDHWWLYNTANRSVNNWTAVCNGHLVGAAIYLEDDLARLAEMIARAARSLDDYMATFGPDGGSSEGPGYWGFGYGSYVLLAHLVEQRTNRAINFLQGEQILKISQFPLGTVMSPGKFVNFSDCDADVSFASGLLAFLSWRLAIPNLMKLDQEQTKPGYTVRRRELPWHLRSLFWRIQPSQQRFIPAKHDWYSGLMWMIARREPENPDALVLAVKGGHNDEMHNQNDVGSFIVHYKGESLIADPGRGHYTRDYFSEKRYEHFVTQSFGHSAPIPNGYQQSAGKEYAASLVDHHHTDEVDYIVLQLKNAYPAEADLISLQRTVTLHRDTAEGWVSLSDTFEYASQPGEFESVLITFGTVDVGLDAVTIHGENGALRVEYGADLALPRVEVMEDVVLSTGLVDIKRVIFALPEPSQSGKIELRILPV